MIMKRRDLERRIAKLAQSLGQHPVYKEGGNHTKVAIGAKTTVIPRHNEIDEKLARAILKQLGGN